MAEATRITPFNHCPALDGYHCQTNALAKIFYHNGTPLSEDTLLGLGVGVGFIYWQMKMGQQNYVFIGGRANPKGFFGDIAKRTGVKIEVKTTSSANKAETILIEKLSKHEPVMVFGDMGFLPWFDLPKDYHFGGHTFVVCGFDGNNKILASDMDQKASGLKKGFYYPITLKELANARGSNCKPFPPKNAYIDIDFSGFRVPHEEDYVSALKQTVASQLNPPIKNIGIKGLRYSATEIIKWPKNFSEHQLRMKLFNLYIFFEVGGTGGGCFRYMYSRFLAEAANVLGSKSLLEASDLLQESGTKFTKIGNMFANFRDLDNIEEKVGEASKLFAQIADIEENGFRTIANSI